MLVDLPETVLRFNIEVDDQQGLLNPTTIIDATDLTYPVGLLIAPPTNMNKVGVCVLPLLLPTADNVDQFPPKSDVKLSHIEWVASSFGHESLLLPLVASLSPSNSVTQPTVPHTGYCGSGACATDDTKSDFPPQIDQNLPEAHPRIFHHRDCILHWYGPDSKSPQESAEETLKRDQELLKEYIQSNSKLTAQLVFMKNLRKKKQTDINLAQDYRFIVSLYKTLQAMEFEVCILLMW